MNETETTTDPRTKPSLPLDYRGTARMRRAPRRRIEWGKILSALPAAVIVAICSGLPLLWMIGCFVANPTVRQELGLSSFRLHLMGRTLAYNGAAAAIATAMGIPAGFVLGRGRGFLAKALWVVLPAALLMPSLSYAYGWAQLVRIARPMVRPFGITFIPGGTADILRCIWSLAAWLWAVPAGLIGLALRRMDTAVQQQAVLDGALRRVTFRQLLGPIVASLAVVTVLATQEFAVYEPTGISVVATEVRMVFDTGAYSSADNSIAGQVAQGSGFNSPDQPARAAAALATAAPLLAVTVLLAVAAAWGSGRVSAAEAISMGDWPRVLNASVWTGMLAVLLVLLNVGVPVTALLKSLHVPFAPGRMWSEFGPQVQGSILVAAMAAAIAGIAALSAAGGWTPGLMALGGASFLVGGQLLAIALIRIYNRPATEWVYNAFPVTVICYMGRFGWLALAAGRGTWSRPWRELRDMAAVDGAGPLRAAFSVVWPLAWPTLAAGALLVGALSLTEVPATVLLFPQHPQVLTPTLMTWVHMARFDPMIEASLLMMGSVLVPAVAAVTLTAIGLKTLRLGLRRGAVSAALLGGILLLPLLAAGCGGSSKPEAIWFDTGTAPGQVVYPRGIAYSPKDKTFFLVDRMARIQHFDLNGKFINGWRMPEWVRGKPVGLAVDPENGNVWVADTHYSRVQVFTAKGEHLFTWGGFGTKPGQFIYPTDIAFDHKGRILISEYGDNDRIQVFDRSGKFLYSFGRFGSGDGEFSRPQTMVLDGDLLYVTDACNHRICVFTIDGKWVRNMGHVGSGLGEFRFPYGMSMDAEGHLIVCEFGNNRVQMIDKETGKGLKIWGGQGREPGQFAYPWGVIVDHEDRVLAVDAGNNRVQVFEF